MERRETETETESESERKMTEAIELNESLIVVVAKLAEWNKNEYECAALCNYFQ